MPGGTLHLDPSYGSGLTTIVEAPPDRSGGVGGWQASERVGRRPGKWFKSQPDDTLSWQLILDRDATVGSSIEHRLLNLRYMGVPHSGKSEPPVIKLSGDLNATDAGMEWVVEDVKLGERLYASDGTLVRYHVTVDFSRYNEIGEIEALRITRTRASKKKRRRTIKSKNGDTLRGIALRELGSGARWKDLVKWNKSLKRVDPDARLRANLSIKVL